MQCRRSERTVRTQPEWVTATTGGQQDVECGALLGVLHVKTAKVYNNMLQLIILFVILAFRSVFLLDIEPVSGISSIKRNYGLACSIDMVKANSTCRYVGFGPPLNFPDRLDYDYNYGEFRVLSQFGNYFSYQRFQEQTLNNRGGLITYLPVYAMLTLPNGTVVIAFEKSLAFTNKIEYTNFTYYGQFHFPTDYSLVQSFTEPHTFIYEEDLDTFIVQVHKSGEAHGQLARVHIKPVINNTLQVDLLPVNPQGLLWKYNGKFIGYVYGTFSWIDFNSGIKTPFMTFECPGAGTVDWGKEQIYHVTICKDKQMLEIVNFDGTNHFQAVDPGLINTEAIGLSRRSAGCDQPCLTHNDCAGVCNICRLKKCVDTGECDSYCIIDADCYTCSIFY